MYSSSDNRHSSDPLSTLKSQITTTTSQLSAPGGEQEGPWQLRGSLGRGASGDADRLEEDEVNELVSWTNKLNVI